MDSILQLGLSTNEQQIIYIQKSKNCKRDSLLQGPMNNEQVLMKMQSFLTENLLRAPAEIKRIGPSILSIEGVSILIFSAPDYLIIDFLKPIDRDRIRQLQRQNINPFFPLIKPREIEGPVFFSLGDKSRNIYFGKTTLKDGFGFAIGKDCTLILEEVTQSVLIKGVRNESTIDLAYIISFGDQINKENVIDFLSDAVSYSFEIWRKRVGSA